jgi:hypothetical protein
MTSDELCDAVEAAVGPESTAVLEEIMAQVEEYDAIPLGEHERERPHGFVWWLIGLRQGWATLPERIPHEVLLAWRDGYTNHPCRWSYAGRLIRVSPVPVWRCRSCWMVLPNSSPGDKHSCAPVFPCPVCGGRQLAQLGPDSDGVGVFGKNCDYRPGTGAAA